MNNSLTDKGDLKPLELIVMGGALFSMHFGAASMIWPMEWGKAGGSHVLTVFLGVFITALLLVLLAYVGLSKTNGDFTLMARQALGAKAGQVFALFTVTVLCFYGVPRMSAAVWDAILQATGFDPASRWPLIFFTLFFYALAYLFLLSPGKVMDRIGKFLFPVLLVTVIMIIGKGLITPISGFNPPTHSGTPFGFGFVSGYATAEIICALIFGIVILNNCKEKGVTDERMSKNIARVGIVGIGMLTCTHFGNMIIGSTSGPDMINLTYTQLYTAVAFRLLGNIGGMVFVIAVFFAAITTAVGIGSATGEFYETASGGKVKYKYGIILAMVISAVFGCLGLTDLLKYVGPFLDGIYPATIILVLHYSLMPDATSLKKLNACRWAMCIALVFGFFDIVKAYANLGLLGSGGDAVVAIYSQLPLFDSGLPWVPFAVVAYIIGYFVFKDTNNKEEIVAA